MALKLCTKYISPFPLAPAVWARLNMRINQAFKGIRREILDKICVPQSRIYIDSLSINNSKLQAFPLGSILQLHNMAHDQNKAKQDSTWHLCFTLIKTKLGSQLRGILIHLCLKLHYVGQCLQI